jgi:hypothetical protein
MSHKSEFFGIQRKDFKNYIGALEIDGFGVETNRIVKSNLIKNYLLTRNLLDKSLKFVATGEITFFKMLCRFLIIKEEGEIINGAKKTQQIKYN